jgi:hypothetical protein
MRPSVIEWFRGWLVPVGSGLLAGGVARWAMVGAGVDEGVGDGVGALVTLAVVEGLRRRRHEAHRERGWDDPSHVRADPEDS